MFHRAFVHAMLIDYAEGRDGSSWDRKRQLSDSLIETSSRFDGLFEPAVEGAAPQASEPPRGGGIGALLGGLSRAFE
jgi:hypothetical protein